MHDFFKQRIKNEVPDLPGVYLWKNAQNKIIYVGKALSLKKRMRQYFEGSKNSRWTPKMVEEIKDFEIRIAKNEKEAFLLEIKLINLYNPPYNILLKNNNKYPYLQIKKNPKNIEIDIKFNFNKAENVFSYGPFPPGYGLRVIRTFLESEFLYKDGFKIKDTDWKDAEIDTVFENIKDTLNLKDKGFIGLLEQRIKKFEELELYEKIIDLNKIIDSLKKNQEQIQNIQLETDKDFDVLVFREDSKTFFAFLYSYRLGVFKNTFNESFSKNTTFESFCAQFVEKYYERNYIPDKVILESSLEDFEFEFSNIKSKITFPKQGKFRNVLDFVIKQVDSNDLESIQQNSTKQQSVFNELKELLSLKKLEKLVIVDNSFQINNKAVTFVMAMDVFGNISSKNFFYYHPTSEVAADIKLMEIGLDKYINSNKFINPDLIIVDGFDLQINTAASVLSKNKIKNIALAGLVKNEKHQTSHLIDEFGYKKEISDDLFRYLSFIQIEVDRIAKAAYNKRKNQTMLKS
ncbi:GIY-YIG nuclease family protein [Mycoplasma procyoni]|uniref:GIY-YIG nuclease family protein n=1 Tax=Mycoplasma procyoni TaxID=568784 RepID=UPI00197B7CD3|nr:GIY-YIG nuclease family protein [Mycoplasma procyoni]MBN3534393.1 GIY-YIG nuclease family protein [Mycoplasma procyoni]